MEELEKRFGHRLVTLWIMIIGIGIAAFSLNQAAFAVRELAIELLRISGNS